MPRKKKVIEPIVEQIIIDDDSRVDFLKGLVGEVEIRDILEGIQVLNKHNLSEIEIKYILLNSWQLLYREKPPTPEEFLTPLWIGDCTIYPHVKEIFIEFFNTKKEYRHLYLSVCIGWGKTFLSSLIMLYSLTIANLLKDNKKYFDINSSALIVGAVASFTIAKAKANLSSEVLRIMRNSPKYRLVKFEDRIKEVQDEEIRKGTNKIVYCRASGDAETLFQLSNDVHVVAVSDALTLLGLNVLVTVVTEASFFPDETDAIAIIDEAKGRVYSRFSGHYLGRVVIDSSPYTIKNTIEKKIYITGEFEKDSKNMIVKGVFHWDVHKSKYPLYYKENKYFLIYRGGEGNPTKEISENEVKNYKADEVIKFPADIINLYREGNPEKVIRDYASYPSGVAGGLITNYTQIEEMFDTSLKNFLNGVNLPESQKAERLLWDKIVDQYFIKVTDGYEFYRNKNEKRWIGVDLALSGDIASIVMLHPELNKQGEKIIVIDFQIPILHDKENINLDAIIQFIYDLKILGRINIAQANFDGFQSADGIQRLKRLGINISKESVDSDKAPYYMLISMIKQGRVKAGRSIFCKNNLKSLVEVDYERKEGTKVEHTKGKLVNQYSGSWETSDCGINAKDITDGTASALYTCMNQIDNYVPTYIYTPQMKPEEVVVSVLDKLAKDGFLFN